MNWKRIISLIVGAIIVMPAYADQLHSVDNIEQVAYEYALKQAQDQFDGPRVVMDRLDPRLRLQLCGAELAVSSNKVGNGMGRQTIAVKCHAPVSWMVYVPVSVKVFKQVVITNRALTINHLITRDDVALRQADVSLLRRGFITDINHIVGQQLKYSVAMGSVIAANNVKPQKIVKRGEHIMLVASVGAMEVRMSGTALSDAVLGQRIKVKNNSSKRIVEGTVEAPGIVEVIM